MPLQTPIRRPFARLCWTLLLTGLFVARSAAAPTADEVARDLERARGWLALARAGQVAPLQAQLPDVSAGNLADWTTALQERVETLTRRLAGLRSAAPADPGPLTAAVEQLKARLAAARGAPEATLPATLDDAAVKAIEGQLGERRTQVDAAQGRVREAQELKVRLTADARAAAEARAALAGKLAGAPPPTPVGQFRRATAQLELAVHDEQLARLAARMRGLDLELSAAQLQLELAQEALRRAAGLQLRLRLTRMGAESLKELRAEHEAATALLALLSTARLDEARKKGLLPAGYAETAAPDWLTAVGDRVSALATRVEAQAAVAELPAEAALQAHVSERTTRLEQLQKRPPPVPTETDPARQVAQLQPQLKQAQAEQDVAQKALDGLAEEAKQLARVIAALPARELGLRKALEDRAGASAAPLDQYRIQTQQVALVGTLDELARRRAELARVPLRERIASLDRDLARLRVEQLQLALTSAARRLEQTSAVATAAAAAEAARAQEAAARERRPIAGFRLRTQASLAALKVAMAEDRALRTRTALELELQRPENVRLKDELGRLTQQLGGDQARSERTVQFLLRNRQQLQERVRSLETDHLPRVRRALDLRLTAHSETTELLWDLQRSGFALSGANPDDGSAFQGQLLRDLLTAVPTARRAEALTAYREAAAELRPILQDRRTLLDEVVAQIRELIGVYSDRRRLVAELQTLITRHIYWIRNDQPLGWAVLAGLPDELRALRAQLPESGRALRERARGVRWWSTLAGLLVLIAAWALASRWLRAKPGASQLIPVRRLPPLERLLDSLLVGGIPPLILLGAVWLCARWDLPPVVAGVLRAGLLGLMSFQLVGRLNRVWFAPRGVFPGPLRVPGDVCELVRRNARRIAWLTLLLWTPWQMLALRALGLSHLPRLVYTALLLCGTWVALALLRPANPLALAITGRGPLRTTWRVGFPVVALLLLGIVGMDLAGYRVGSGLFTLSALQLLLGLAAIAALHPLLTRIVSSVAYGVLARLPPQPPGPPPAPDDGAAARPPAPAPVPVEAAPAAADTRPATDVESASATTEAGGESAAPAADAHRVTSGSYAAIRAYQRVKGPVVKPPQDPSQLLFDAIPTLSRLAGTLVIGVGVLVLAGVFGLLESVRGFASVVVLFRWGGAGVTLWNLLCAGVWVGGAHLLLAYLPSLLELAGRARRGDVDEGVLFVMTTLLRYAILIVAYGAALLTLHVSLASLAWLMAALSFGIGFGLQEIIANFISGLILLVERPVRVGDLVTIGAHVGTVKRINIRSTLVDNYDQQTIILPNKKLITDDVINWTYTNADLRRTLRLGVAYGSDVSLLLKILYTILDEHPDVLDEPTPPQVLFESFGDSCLNFLIRFHAPIDGGLRIVSEVHDMIHRRLAAAGITIPFPQRDVHVIPGGSGPLALDD